MSRTAQRARMEAYAARELGQYWRLPLVTEQVVDLTDPVQFPEIHLARLHAAKLRGFGQ